MTIYREFGTVSGQYSACIGFFDGVHQGHRFLLAHLRREAARAGLHPAVVTFWNHPRSVVHPADPLRIIDSPEERLAKLAQTGVEACFVIDFTPEVRRLTAERFIADVLSRQMHIRQLIIGYDHRFGRDRSEGFDDYVRYGRACGMEVVGAPVYDDGSGRHYSSSEVRRSLAAGRVAEAALLLGQPYRLTGTVVHGHALGRRLGFPTANLSPADPDKIVPAPGVYAAWAAAPGLAPHPAMVNIGHRPTVAPHDPTLTIEAHLIEPDRAPDGPAHDVAAQAGHDALDLYGQPLTLAFIQRLRDERQLASLDDLRRQLASDRARTLASLTPSDQRATPPDPDGLVH